MQTRCYTYRMDFTAQQQSQIDSARRAVASTLRRTTQGLSLDEQAEIIRVLEGDLAAQRRAIALLRVNQDAIDAPRPPLRAVGSADVGRQLFRDKAAFERAVLRGPIAGCSCVYCEELRAVQTPLAGTPV